MSAPTAQVSIQFWLWTEPVVSYQNDDPEPKGLAEAAIVEVRSWRCGEYQVWTPQYTYVHCECVGSNVWDDVRPDALTPDPEMFTQLVAHGKVHLIGSRSDQCDSMPSPPAA